MTKEVEIRIRGLQNGEATDGEAIETIATGEYYFKNNKHYFLYEEVVEREAKPTKNRIKVAPGYLELTKSGVVNVNMLFEENKKNMTHYYTPYGCLDMGIDTKDVVISESEDEIQISAKYGLEINEEFVADCDITITATSKR